MNTLYDSSIIINHSLVGHGCSRKCNYCNWKDSENLPKGIQDFALIKEFIESSDKDIITISGGGDPLWNINENGENLLKLINFIKIDMGKKVRIITREVKNLSFIKDKVDFVSVSLDNSVMKQLKYTEGFNPGSLDFSMVLPPLSTEEIAKYKPYYIKLLEKLKRPLVLRENLNSVFSLNFSKLSFGDNIPIKILPKKYCFEGRYLANTIVRGYQLLLNRKLFIKTISGLKGLYFFGGFAKHVLTQGIYPYNDIDIVMSNNGYELFKPFMHDFIVMDNSFRRGKLRYIKLRHKLDKTFELHIVVFIGFSNDAVDSIINDTILNNSQLDVDRFYYYEKFIYSDNDTSIIRDKILSMEAIESPTNDESIIFNGNETFNRYKQKMQLKGWTIKKIRR